MTDRLTETRARLKAIETERVRIAELAARADKGEWPDDRIDHMLVLLHDEAKYPVSEQHMHGHMEYMRAAFVLLAEEVRALRDGAKK